MKSGLVKHLQDFILNKDYRKSTSLISTTDSYFYKYGKRLSRIIRPLLFIGTLRLRAKKKLVSVENIPSSIGHLTTELEELCKYCEQNKNDRKIVIFAYPKNKLLSELAPLFQQGPIQIKESGWLHFWYHLVAIAYPKVSVSVAQSNVNYLLGGKPLSVKKTFMGRISGRIRRYVQNPTYLPIKKYVENYCWPSKFVEAVANYKKYVILQIKTNTINGTLTLLKPNTFLKAIVYIKARGYNIVFAGREVMPKEFENLGIINYAQSTFATAINDFFLVNNASFIISSASGFCNIAEVLDRPLLVVNTWHHVFQASRKTIVLPSLLKLNKKNLSFRDQLNFMFESKMDDKNLPANRERLAVEQITSQDIYDAVVELLNAFKNTRPKKFTCLQAQVKKLYPDTPLGFGLSRIPDSYLNKHKKVFVDRPKPTKDYNLNTKL